MYLLHDFWGHFTVIPGEIQSFLLYVQREAIPFVHTVRQKEAVFHVKIGVLADIPTYLIHGHYACFLNERWRFLSPNDYR